MSFPTSPTNGQIAVVNNVAYEYASANTSWTRVLSIANIIQANVISANVLNVVQAFSIAGNIATANYFIGNGAFLTGLPVSYSNTDVANYLPTYTGNLVSLTGPVTTTGNITANNVLFGTGVVSGTGTVYAATVSTTGNVNSGFLSTGEASVGNLFSGGYVSASGNVTGSYIFGNGALLTGVITSVSNINNGTSNVTVVSSGGNVTVGVGGTGNVAVFSTTGGYITGELSASGNITGGNVISSGVRVYKWTTVANTAPSGAVPGDNWYDSYADKLYLYVNDGTGNAWVDQSPPTTFASLTVSGNTSSGNLLTAGLVSATGNITGNYIFGNGALLTGVITSVSNINNGTSNVTVVSSGGNISVGVGGTSNVAVVSTDAVTIKGNVLPSANVTYDLGTSTQRWKDLWLSNSTIYLGNAQISANATAVTITNPAGGNTVLQGATPSITGNTVSVSGNITGDNILAGGVISATGNITGGNVLGGANVNATTHTGTTVSVTANVTGGNLLTGGLINATGNITGGNVNTNQVVGTGLTLVSTGDLTLSATGNINVNNEYINNVPTPVADGDAVNKLYVDNFVTGLNVHDAVTAATPTTLATITSGTITYYNGPGSNGVGATLSTTGTFNLIDTVNVQTAGTRILVLNEANAVTNGVYVWSNATAITRASDYNTVPEVEAGDFMFVTNGATYGNTGWIQTSTVSNIGFAGNNITFTQFSGSGTYSAGTGLTLTGTTFSVNASQTQVTSVGTLGSLLVTGNVTGGNVLTGGLISSTGNITGGNLSGTSIVGTLTTASQTNITALGTLGSLTVTANTTSGNLLTGGVISATGNITGGNILGGANVNATTHTGTTVSVTANITGGNILTGGLISATGNITGGNLVLSGGIVDNTGNLDLQTSAANANINFTPNGSGNVYSNANVFVNGLISASGNITGGNIITGAGSGGNLTGANVISANTVTVTANITGGNILTGGIISATGNITGGNLRTAGLISATGTVTGSQFNGSGAGLTSIPGANVSGTVANATYATSAGSSTTASTVTTAAQPNITSVGTLSSVTISGVTSVGGAITRTAAGTGYLNGNYNSIETISTSGAIYSIGGSYVPLATSLNNMYGIGYGYSGQTANVGGSSGVPVNRWGMYVASAGVSRIFLDSDSSIVYAATFSGVSTTAKYADLAELYSADAEYPPGTVVDFGGTCEITLSVESGSNRIAGVVSTNPAHLMNSTLESTHTAAVALSGRVPTLVIGPVRKGDMMVSAGNGHAQACATPAMGTVIGKAVEDFVGASGTIEIAVGRL